VWSRRSTLAQLLLDPASATEVLVEEVFGP